MQIEIGKKYRVTDAERFMAEHGITNGTEFTVTNIDDDGDLYTYDISWNGRDGKSAFAPSEGWALLLNGRNGNTDEKADYTGSIEEV
ncbi:hypothetical protein PHG31p222 [Aeromonas phage 31]|uniref:Uncharacterized protein n=4 Tax=Biquartavirus TaxID=1912143 RepID=Q6U977_9CAUD|nr:hypothetical protein ST44RRORF225c [Aeromonas phage 44RR2.8t]YP_238951.1 hypothetical protein PHG31p222 [Aeromonas phage 31]APU00697.1 hypothetical protein [Aeromonas phage 44RR2.8t.2]APU01116.1 hypothetical protein [Aeromonas phage 31.2]APU02026.1 hypothetical protein [Aeromonas phage L9-6]APU02277.1 hypothetical protein [Aeromonas phage Riv-10]APU02525.1 hypothetical protein [Aeromonas phage SW69-9]UYD59534.1 hypothetical protein JNMOADIG_00005 [Aeromonas phage avDM5]UYD60492.1 hypothe